MRIESINQITPIKNVEPVGKEVFNANTKENDKTIVQNNEPKKVSEEELIATIESANKKFEIYDKRLEFSIHEKTKEIVVKIIDTKTDEIIKEIPPEKILDMVAKLMELAGILVDEKI
jgi:flagellar protein FlaG